MSHIAVFRVLKSHSGIPLLMCKRTFYEPQRGGYPKVYDTPREQLNIFQRAKKVCREFKGEWKLFMQEIRDDYKLFILPLPVNEIDVVWKFDGTQKSLKQWIVNSDKDYYHGFSTAKLELSPQGTGIFHGTLDTRVTKDGKTTKSGYCNITSVDKLKSFKRKVDYDWSKYNTLVLRVRGDGRCYMLNILQRGAIDLLWYNASYYVMYTRGGPYWQTVKVPFGKFAYAPKGQLHIYQHEIMKCNISNFGITLGDKKPGPFKLEIDYIGVSFVPANNETCAYEMYDVIRK